MVRRGELLVVMYGGCTALVPKVDMVAKLDSRAWRALFAYGAKVGGHYFGY